MTRDLSKRAEPARRSRLRAAVELAMFVVVLAVPLLGVWAASSLAAYWNGSRTIALTAGVLVFPALPLLWEGVAELRRRRRGQTGERILTLGDRVTLRTLTTSTVFLLPMVWLWPAPLFQALTTRGDWFLDDADGAWVPPLRRSLLGTADGLGWLFDRAHENPWREHDGGAPSSGGTGSGSAPTSATLRVLEDEGRASDEPPLSETVEATHEATSSDVPPEETDVLPTNEPAPVASMRWPFPDRLHPLAHAPPADAEASIASLAAYYRDAIADPAERAKAIHDWIADHVAYDAVSYASGEIPPQSAEDTFRTRLSVCAGYAYLFTALASAAALHVETVVGDARHGSGEPEGHAWNAIELDGAWALIDVTWDAGSVSGTTFTRAYRAEYFMAPPEAMGMTHLPDDPRWQLRDPPLSRGEWNRQPMLTPAFFAAGLRLVSPDRIQVETDASVSARVESSGRNFLMATAEPIRGGARTECQVTGNATFDVRCRLPSPGTWTIRLYRSPVRYGTYEGVASFEALYR